MKRLIKNGLIITITIVFLTSCSHGIKSNETNSKNIFMGNIFNSNNEHISYMTTDENPIEKETPIYLYIVTKKGKAKIYDGTGDTTLGDVSKMDEDEIKDRMKKEDKKWFKKDKKDTIDYLEKGSSTVKDVKEGFKGDKDIVEETKTYKNSKEYVDKYGNIPQKYLDKIENQKYKEPKFNNIKISVKTDGSGNKTQKEKFKFQMHGFKQGDYKGPEEGSDKYYYMKTAVANSATYTEKYNMEREFEDTVAVTDIYDKKYAGLSFLDEDDEGEAHYLITGVGDKTKEMKFDKPKAKYIDYVDGKKQ